MYARRLHHRRGQKSTCLLCRGVFWCVGLLQDRSQSCGSLWVLWCMCWITMMWWTKWCWWGRAYLRTSEWESQSSVLLNSLPQSRIVPILAPDQFWTASASMGMSVSQFQHWTKNRSQFQHWAGANMGANIYENKCSHMNSCVEFFCSVSLSTSSL